MSGGGAGGDSEASSASLAAIRARQAKWMRERQAELDREGVMQELEQAAGMLRPAGGIGATASGDGERGGGEGGGVDGGVGSGASTSGVCGGDSGGGRASSTSFSSTSRANHDGGVNGFKPEQVIDRLTERITDRLRDELRVELQKEQADIGKNAAAMGQHVEGVLASEIASHTCPICYDLMVPPDSSPTLLFPCGHTFCAKCLKSHVETHGKNKCPYCRQDIESQALNMSLQQIIQNFVSARDKIPKIHNGRLMIKRRTSAAAAAAAGSPNNAAKNFANNNNNNGEGGGGGGRDGSGEGNQHDDDDDFDFDDEEEELAPSEMEMMYTQQLRTVSVRCRILRNELADIEEEREDIRNRALTASTVLNHLRGEESELKGRLQAIMKELEVVREQVEEQERRVVDVTTEEEDYSTRRELVVKTLEPLEEELRKVSVLLEHVAPGVAATIL